MIKLLRSIRSSEKATSEFNPVVTDLMATQNQPIVADTEVTPDDDTFKGSPATEEQIQAANVNIAAWLPFAAKAYNISPNIDDYFFRQAPLFLTDLPNRNGVSFPAVELAKWSVDGGCQTYMTWRGKPMHVEHQDENPLDAIGVIVDVAMVPLTGYANNKLWKVVALFALDRTKNPRITGAIERGERNTYSMGCLVEGYTCSYCGAQVGKCNHIDPEDKVTFYELNGKLVFKQVYGIEGREFSSVADPAFGVAASDYDGHISLK